MIPAGYAFRLSPLGEDDASPEHCEPRHVAPDVTSHSCKRIIGMSGSSRYTRAISAEVGEIERRLRGLERDLEKIGGRASASARDTAEGLGDAVAAALSGWADRFRLGAGALGGQSASIGKDAAKLGNVALARGS